MRITPIRLFVPLLMSGMILSMAGCDSSFELIQVAATRNVSPEVSDADAVE